MAVLGRINKLTVSGIDPDGAYLDAGDAGDLLLPERLVPTDCKVGDSIEVFVYLDSRENLVATTENVAAQVDEVAYLKVVAVNNVGAFLQWGLPKDLLVPFNQQQIKMQVDKSYLVYIYLDEESNRLAASSKLNKFIYHEADAYKRGQAVELMISDKTDIGYSAVINNKHWGVLFYSDVVKPVLPGQRLKGYIKKIREDGKIDLCLEPIGYAKVDPLSARILEQLEANDGFIPLSDKSSPDLIYERFGVSKKSYKMSIGSLYKKRLITIAREGISLLPKD